MANLLFVSNFNKTYFFHEIANKLKSEGHNIFWIALNKRLYDFLLKHNSKESVTIIQKPPQNAASNNADDPHISDLGLNELVYGDRVLRYQPAWAYAFLRSFVTTALELIKTRQIAYVFGEATWAHEIALSRLVNSHSHLNCRFANPHTIRIPDGRFAFFADEFQCEIHERNGRQQTYEESDFAAVKPKYLSLNDSLLKKAKSPYSRIARIKRFLTMENIDPLDPMVIANRWLSFKAGVREEINRETYRFVKRSPPQDLVDTQYIFLALHKQPEASIDVLGRYYEDQLANIINIWRSLPDGWILAVKEHTNAIGDRPISFYANLKRLPNVLLIDEKADSHQLIKGAAAVATVSGTVAYEAALLGVKSYTFAPTFFNRFPSCSRLTLEDMRNRDCWTRPADSRKSTSSAMQYIFSNSFPGQIGDPVSNPAVMNDSNITDVYSAFSELVNC